MDSTSEPVPAIGIDPRSSLTSARSTALHAIASAFMFVSPLILFVPAALLNSGLRNGWKGLVGAILGGSAILGLVGAYTRSGSMGGVAGAARLLLEIGLPTVMVFQLIRQRFRFGTVLLAALGVAAGGFLTTELLMRAVFHYSPYTTLIRNFRQDSLKSLEFYRNAGMPADALTIMKSLSDGIASSFMPFLLIMITATMFLLSLMMIARLPSGRATGGTYLFRNFGLPDWVLFAFVAGGLSPLASGFVRVAGLNLLATVGFLYFLQGLAILRYLLVTVKAGIFGVTLVFGIVALLTIYGVAPFLLFLAGLFDPFFDFRHLNRKDDSHESHTH